MDGKCIGAARYGVIGWNVNPTLFSSRDRWPHVVIVGCKVDLTQRQLSNTFDGSLDLGDWAGLPAGAKHDDNQRDV